MTDIERKRHINKIIIHCSATPHGTTRDSIRKYHKEVNGWDDIGYHYVIESSGDLKYGRDIDIPGAHCRGQNANSIGICIVGGIDSNGKKHKWNSKQIDTLDQLLEGLFMSCCHTMKIYPHNCFNKKKTCPDHILEAVIPERWRKLVISEIDPQECLSDAQKGTAIES